MTRWLVVLVAMVLVCAHCKGQPLSAETLRVARARVTNRELLKKLPLYTCLVTIKRNDPHDVVQLDVGVGESRELYSWPGESTFSSMDLGDLVGHGLLSTGMFSGFARNLFVGDHGIIHAAGEGMVLGRRAFHFTYSVPSMETSWKINWFGRQGELGEAGEFWVDEDDFHLMSLRVAAADIPPLMLLRSLTMDIEYGMYGGTLLPSGGSVSVVEMKGKVHQNSVAFSHCRVFGAESFVSTNDDEMATVLSRYKQQQATLRAGLNLPVILSEDIPVKTAKVGDLVSARLESNVQVSKELVLAAGTALQGRLRMLAKLDDPPNTYQVGIAFSELVAGDVSYRFMAKLSGMQPVAGIQMQLSRDRAWRTESFAGTTGGTTSETTFSYEIPGAATFFLSNAVVLPKGLRMTWRTVASAQGTKAQRLDERRNPR